MKIKRINKIQTFHRTLSSALGIIRSHDLVHRPEQRPPPQAESYFLGSGGSLGDGGAGGGGGGGGGVSGGGGEGRLRPGRLARQELLEDGVHLAADHLLVHHSPLHLDKGRSVRGPEAPLSHSVQSVSSLLRHRQVSRGGRGGRLAAGTPLASSLSPGQRSAVAVYPHPVETCVLRLV